jgi:hypothetical protein
MPHAVMHDSQIKLARCMHTGDHYLTAPGTLPLTSTAETVDNIIVLAYVLLQRRSRARTNREAKIAQGVISRRQLQW